MPREIVRRRIGRVLLALALLAGWQAALEHPIAHVDAAGELVHRHDGHAPGPGELCDVLAALTACASGAAQPVLPSPVLTDRFLSNPKGEPRTAEALPFRSQGPPAAA